LGGGILLKQNILLNIKALENLEELEDSLSISSEPITSLNGIHNLQNITLNSQIYNNENLQDLNDLESLKTLGRDLRVLGNDTLEDLCALTTAMNNGFSGSYLLFSNAYNPSLEDLQNGDCSL
jgi:hypothetical protein